MTVMGDWAEGYFKSVGWTPDVEIWLRPGSWNDGNIHDAL